MKPLPKKFFIRVPAPEISKIVQKKLFELNYRWATDFTSTEHEMQHTEYPIILSGSWVEYYDGPNKFRVLGECSGGVKDIEEYLDKLVDYQEISITDLFRALPFNKMETFSDYEKEFNRLMANYEDSLNHQFDNETASNQLSDFVLGLVKKVTDKK